MGEKKMMGYVQKIGKSLMLPVAVLPAAALLLGFGNFIDPSHSNAVAVFLGGAGETIIGNMSLLFAVGVAYGMSKDSSGAAAVSGMVGFTVVTGLLTPEKVTAITGSEASAAFGNINNQFVGIMMGLIAAGLYNRFSDINLPSVLAFFSGRRFVPIITSASAAVIALVLLFVWPLLWSGIEGFATLMTTMGGFGAGVFGAGTRLLIPLGLHHALNAVVLYGGVSDVNIFLMGQTALDTGEAVKGVTGMFQGGFFPITMFGLPGAALAMWSTARTSARKKTAGLMLAAAATSFLTGITEPIEFAFMFAAPVLYVVHAILTGVSYFVAATMQWTLGYGFSASAFDMILSSRNPIANQWWMLLLLGIVMFGVYFVVFRWLILKKDLKTVGREQTKEESKELPDADDWGRSVVVADRYMDALGGPGNIVEVDNCITRLRMTLNDTSFVDKDACTELGAAATVILDKHHAQVIVGTKAEEIAREIKQIMFEDKEAKNERRRR